MSRQLLMAAALVLLGVVGLIATPVQPPDVRVLLTASPRAIISPSCTEHVFHYVSAIFSAQLWALHMLDATPKVPDGLLYGNLNQMGNFEECLEVHVDNAPRNSSFVGQYCRAQLALSLPAGSRTPSVHEAEVLQRLSEVQKVLRQRVLNVLVPPHPKQAVVPLVPHVQWAFCVPSSCSSADVEAVVQTLLPPLLLTFLGIDLAIDATVDPALCYQGDTLPPLPSEAWYFIGFLCILLAIVLAFTGYDIWWQHRKPKNVLGSPVLVRAVSLRSNLAQLLSTRREAGSLGCLHGLRVISTLWIILAHRYSEETTGAVSNLAELPKFYEAVAHQTVLNALLGVDTFFLLSGFLVCHVFLRQMERRGAFSPASFYFYRYVRLTAPLAVVLGFYTSLFPYIGRGPLWDSVVTSATNACNLNWWTVVLYVQNYVGGPSMCLTQSWYLAVDMQLAWVSPLLLLPLWKWPRQTSSLAILLLLASCFAPFAVTFANSLPWSHTQNMFSDIQLTVDFFEKIYWPTYMRATPYLVGLILAYYLNITKDEKCNMNKSLVLAGWACSTAVCLTVIYSLTIPYQSGYEYSRIDAAFYAGFHRLGWSLGVAWVIFACVKGFAGPVNCILSWRFLLPLSRLCYCAYLVQLIVILYDVGMGRTPNYFSNFNSVHTFLGDLPMVFGLAFVLHLLVEAPLMSVMRYFFRGGRALQLRAQQQRLQLDGAMLQSAGAKQRHSLASPATA